MSRNYRKRKFKYTGSSNTVPRLNFEEKGDSQNSRPHRKRAVTPRKRRSKKNPPGYPTEEGLKCYGRKNLSLHLNFTPRKGTSHDRNPKAKRIRCHFCSRQGVFYTCGACGSVFCMRPPVHLTIPESNPPRKFRANGLFCWHYVHGYKTKSELRY